MQMMMSETGLLSLLPKHDHDADSNEPQHKSKYKYGYFNKNGTTLNIRFAMRDIYDDDVFANFIGALPIPNGNAAK